MCLSLFIWYPKANEILQCPSHHQVSIPERKPVENVTSEFVAIMYVTFYFMKKKKNCSNKISEVIVWSFTCESIIKEYSNLKVF